MVIAEAADGDRSRACAEWQCRRRPGIWTRGSRQGLSAIASLLPLVGCSRMYAYSLYRPMFDVHAGLAANDQLHMYS